jgi:uncharacterized membrane protein YhhN
MFTVLPQVMLALAFVDWAASWRGWIRVRWFTKPAVLLLLIAWFTQVSGWRGDLFWFGLGLVFSLLGDVLLMLPSRFFLFGVGAFSLAHIAYIVGFWQMPLDLRWQILLPVLLIVLIFWLLNQRIQKGLRQNGETSMRVPVMAYAAVLSLMWLSALSTLLRPDWSLPMAVVVSIGAGLFFLSDSLLAGNRFVRPLPAADLLVMVTYHLGQILIVAGVLGQYTGM